MNIRVIAATNENTEKLMKDKLLREDLYYRLSVFQLDLPPLSERKEDIEALIDYYIEFYNRHMQIKIEKVDDEVLHAFQQYNWPGNVRELKNAIETLTIMQVQKILNWMTYQ